MIIFFQSPQTQSRSKRPREDPNDGPVISSEDNHAVPGTSHSLECSNDPVVNNLPPDGPQKVRIYINLQYFFGFPYPIVRLERTNLLFSATSDISLEHLCGFNLEENKHNSHKDVLSTFIFKLDT